MINSKTQTLWENHQACNNNNKTMSYFIITEIILNTDIAETLWN